MKSNIKIIFLICFFITFLFFIIRDKAKVESSTIDQNPAIQAVSKSSAWWKQRHNEKIKRIQQEKVDLLMIGDSITHGWEEQGYDVWQKYYQHRNAANLGFSGDRTEHVLWRLQNGEIDGVSPKVAVVMIGTNNSGQRNDSSKQIAEGIKAIIVYLRENLPSTKIILLAIFPRSKNPLHELRKINDETNKIIAAYADNQNIFFLNINDNFLDEKGNLSRNLMPDLLHPNAAGYQIWAEVMEKLISQLMGD